MNDLSPGRASLDRGGLSLRARRWPPTRPAGASLRCAPETAGYGGPAGLDLWPALARIACPVRVVAGDRSFVALERPSEVGDSVVRFIRDVTLDRVG